MREVAPNDRRLHQRALTLLSQLPAIIVHSLSRAIRRNLLAPRLSHPSARDEDRVLAQLSLNHFSQ